MPVKDYDPIKNRPDMIKVEVDEVLAESANAYFILWDGGETKQWFPKSQCDLVNNILYVPKWLYDKKVDEVIHG